MAGVNIGNVNLLYIKYQNDILETLNQEALSYKDPQQEDAPGLKIEGRIHVARSGSLGPSTDGGAFSVARRQDYIAYEVTRRFFQASIQLTGGVMAAARKSPQVPRDVVDSEVRGMLTDALKYNNGMYFRDGTGVVATAYNTFTGTTLHVDDASMLWEGATFDVYDSTLATFRGTIQASSIAQALNGSGYAVVTLAANGPAGATSGDKIVWRNGVNAAISGLDSLIDDTGTTFQGVNVANYPRYSSLVMSSAADRPISPQLLRQFLAGLYMKAGKKPGMLKVYASPWQGKEFEEMYEGELRFTPGDKQSGRESLSFQSALGGVNYELDTDCPKDKLFAADLSQLVKMTQKPLGWRLQGGQIFLRSDQSNVWTATMDEVAELYIKERRTSGKIEDLTHDATIAY
jgi:hypothetical protein